MFHNSISGLVALTLATTAFAHSSGGIKPTGTGNNKPTTSSAPYPIHNGTIPLPHGSGTGRPTGTRPVTTYTYETTETFTITSCPPQVTHCPAKTATATYLLTTTVPPKTTQTLTKPTATSTAVFGGYPGGCPVAQTVTQVVTVTNCGPGCVIVPVSTLASGSMPGAPKSTQPANSASSKPSSGNQGSATTQKSAPPTTTLTVVPVIPPPVSHGLSSSFVFTNSTGQTKTRPAGSGTAPSKPTGTAPVTQTAPAETPCTTITNVLTIPVTTITLGPGATTTPCTTITETLTIPITTVTWALNGTTSSSTTWTTPKGTGVTTSAPSAGLTAMTSQPSTPTLMSSSSAPTNGTVFSTLRRVRA